MDNKKLGIILILVSIALIAMLFFIRAEIIKPYQQQIDAYTAAGEACPSDPNLCPHEQSSRAQIPLFIAGAILLGVIALGAYLLFFEKSQKEIVSALGEQKQMKVQEEKFGILLKGLSADEQKVIKAVKEQDGITQQTLRLRTDMHKSKLSIVLDGLEKKGIIKRVESGKTKKIFIKIAL